MVSGERERVLPPGLSEAGFARAVEAFTARLGADAVVRSPEELADYRDPYAVAAPDEFGPSLVVLPGSVEEVQAIVRVANEHRVPLWTVSAGKNLSYGGSAPRLPGSVLVHLRRMNRVLEIDEELAYALVEPGVTFFDLHEALEAGGHRLIASLPALGWGSVVGNVLERGFGTYGEHADLQCGMEVVLADGDVIRTGLGAVPGGRSWQVHQHGFGPTADGIFKQSNFGIVTKMGVWLKPTPETVAVCTLSVERESDLGAMVDALRPLLLQGTVQPNPICMTPLVAAAAMGATRADFYDGDGAIPAEVIGQIAEKLGLGWWTLMFPIDGPDELVDTRLRLIERAVSQIPGATLHSRSYAGGTPVEEIEPPGRGMLGFPGLDALALLNWPGGSGGVVDFSPVAPLTAEDAVGQYQLLTRLAAEHGVDNLFFMHLRPRSFVQTFMIMYDTADESQKRAARAAYRAFMAAAGSLGHAACRAHLSYMDDVAEHYGWNDGALRRFNETLKDALDPNGILAPGKQGIWPAALRPARRCSA